MDLIKSCCQEPNVITLVSLSEAKKVIIFSFKKMQFDTFDRPQKLLRITNFLSTGFEPFTLPGRIY